MPGHYVLAGFFTLAFLLVAGLAGVFLAAGLAFAKLFNFLAGFFAVFEGFAAAFFAGLLTFFTDDFDFFFDIK